MTPTAAPIMRPVWELLLVPVDEEDEPVSAGPNVEVDVTTMPAAFVVVMTCVEPAAESVAAAVMIVICPVVG